MKVKSLNLTFVETISQAHKHSLDLSFLYLQVCHYLYNTLMAVKWSGVDQIKILADL